MIWRNLIYKEEGISVSNPFDPEYDLPPKSLDRGQCKGKRMMSNRRRTNGITLWLIVLLIGSGCTLLPAREVQVPWMTKEELKTRLGSLDWIILDVRKKPDWETSRRKIPGALHEDYEQVKIWASKYPRGKTLVLYCA
jgi:hypothetical protein